MVTIYNFVGAETGNLLDAIATSATPLSVASGGGVPRTGTYAYRVNISVGQARWVEFGGVGATGRPAELGLTTQCHSMSYYKATAHPTTTDIIRAVDAAGNVICAVSVNSSGDMTITGTSSPVSVATGLATATQHKLVLRVNSNGTCGLAVNGGSEVTVTGGNYTLDRFRYGNTTGGGSADYYFDDIVHADSALPSWAVRIALPNSDTGMDPSNAAHWIRNTGSSNYYTYVDEVPSNGATDYWQGAASSSLQYRFIAVQDSTTIGVANSIVCVKVHAAMAESASTTTNGGVGLRSGGVDARCTNADIGTTAYVGVEVLVPTDPATGVAWTTGGFDAALVSPIQETDTTAIYCSAIYAIVLDAVAATPADLVLSAIAGLSDATVTVAAPVRLVPVQVDGLSNATVALRSPTMLSLGPIAGLSNALATLSSPGYLVPGAVTGLSSATATVIANAVLTLSAVAGLSTATATVISLAAGEMTLGPVFGLSNATMAVSTKGFLVPGVAAGLSTATLGLRSPTMLTLSGAQGLSAATLAVQSPILLSMTAAGLSNALVTVSTIARLVPGTISGLSNATLALRSPTMLALGTVAGLSNATMTLISPVRLALGTVAGLSNATLAALKSPVLFQLTADGLSNATISALKSPALLSMTSAGLSSATLNVSSKALLVLQSDGTSLAIITAISLGPTTKLRFPGGIAVHTPRIQAGQVRIVSIGGGIRPVVRISGGY